MQWNIKSLFENKWIKKDSVWELVQHEAFYVGKRIILEACHMLAQISISISVMVALQHNVLLFQHTNICVKSFNLNRIISAQVELHCIHLDEQFWVN